MLPEELISLITEDRLELAQSFLKENILHYDYTYKDYQILRDVLRNGQTQMAELLINKGFRVNLEPQHCPTRTPLHIAVCSGYSRIVELLLAKGAKVDVCDKDNQSPLHAAAKTNNLALADLMLPLVSNGYQADKDGLRPMHIACMRGNTCMVKKFLTNIENMLSPHIKLNINVSKDSMMWPGFTPLHFAVLSNNVETVQVLLDFGADITIMNDSQLTPLHLAHSLQHNQIVDSILLLHKYTCENPATKQNLSHFHIACTRDEPEIVASFLQQRLNPDGCEYNSLSPLGIAMRYQCSRVVNYILDNRIHQYHSYDKAIDDAINNMSSKDVKSITCRAQDATHNLPPIKRITKFQQKCMSPVPNNVHLNSLRRMISEDVAIVNESVAADSSFWPNGTPLHFAVRVGCPNIVRFLVQNGANINAQDALNKTPLHWAFEKEHLTDSIILDSILERSGTIMNPADNHGLTHFHIMCAKDKYKLVEKFLLDNPDVVNDMTKIGCKFWPEFTPLHFAAYFNCFDVVKILLNHGADFRRKNGLGYSALEMALPSVGVIQDMEELIQVTLWMIRLLIQNQRSSVDSSSLNKGFSICQLAPLIDGDYPDLLDEISSSEDINSSIDSDVPRYGGYTALHFAVKYCLTNTTDWLLNHGANPALEDASGNTPLHLWPPNPRERRNIDRRLILPNNPISRETGRSHFHVLCEVADFETLEFALNEFQFDVKQKIEVNFTSAQALMTGLHLIINQSYACKKKIQLLVDKGADVRARDVKWNTPLHYTGKNKLKEDLEILLAHGADINAVNVYGKTPMHELCQSELEDDEGEKYTYIYNFLSNEDNSKFMTNKLKIMLANGADVDIVDGCGDTPLTLRIYRVDWYLADHIIINEHLMKLVELDLPISDKNDLQLQQQRSSLGFIHPLNEEFVSRARSEIQKMRKTETIKPYNLHNSLLVGDANVLMEHFFSARLRNVVESNEFENEFPLYGYMVRLQLKKGKARRDKLDETVPHLNFIVGLEFPKELCFKILQYLTNEELDDFADASFRLSTQGC